MFDLLKIFKTTFPCQKNGVCARNPVINALSALIINEVREIAFYMIKLKELNFTNKEIVKEAIFALSWNITDVDFDKKVFRFQYEKLRTTKKKAEEFYVNKCREMNISYETITSSDDIKFENYDITNLIKEGERLINQVNNNFAAEKAALIEVIILISKFASDKIQKLLFFKEDIFEYANEVLRLISSANNILTREEKLIRRIKEFSNVLYKINEELMYQRRLNWGERTTSTIDTTIYKGKSILVTGGNLEELFELLVQTENKNINVYTDISLVTCFSYPKFRKFRNLKGLWGLSDRNSTLSDFKGVIFVTRNSNKQLENIFRGKIYTTKTIPFEKAIKIDDNDFSALIEDSKNTEGFSKNIEGEKIDFFFDKIAFEAAISEAEGRELFITAGIKNDEIERNFESAVKMDFFPPDETEILSVILENAEVQKFSLYFSICTKETICTILSILDKNIKNILITQCQATDINPHVVEVLKKNFNIKIV